MNDHDALIQFMQDNDFDYKMLAAATGDTPSAVFMMIKRQRPVGQAFKWRFAKTFGWAEADRLFDVPETPLEAELA